MCCKKSPEQNFLIYDNVQTTHELRSVLSLQCNASQENPGFNVQLHQLLSLSDDSVR